MTSPNVGNVTLGVGIEAENLTRDILARTLPVLQKYTDAISKANKEITKVKGDPFEDVAEQARKAADEMGRVAKATDNAAEKERLLHIAQERSRKAIILRGNARRAERAEIEKTGAAEEKTIQRRISAENAAAIAIEARQAREKQVADTRHKIAQEEITDQRKISDAVGKARALAIQAIQDQADDQRKATRQIISDAEKESDAVVAESRNQMDAREKATDKAAKDAKNLTDKLRIEEEARAKNAEKARQREARAQRTELRRQSRESTFANLSGLGRELGALRNIATPPAIALAIGLISQLVTVASSASTAIIGIPGAIAAIGAAVGTVQVGLSGFEDTLTALFEMDADPEKFVEALSKLAPGAQDAVLAIKDVLPLWRELQQATQEALFGPEVTEGIKNLSATFQPVLKILTTGIADSLSNMFGTVAETLLHPDIQGAIFEFVNNVVRAFEVFEPAVEPLTRAFAVLTAEGSDVLPRLADAAVRAATAFADLVDKVSRSGELNQWLNEGIDTLGVIVGWVKELVAAWFELAPVGRDLLPEIDQLVRGIIGILPELITLFANITAAADSWVIVLELVDPILDIINSDVLGISDSFMGMLNPLQLVYNLVKATAILLDALPWIEIKSLAGMDLGNQDPAVLAQRALEEAQRRATVRGGAPGIEPFPNLPPAVGIPSDLWNTIKDIPGVIRDRTGRIRYAPPPSLQTGGPPTNLTEAAAPSEAERRKAIEEMFNPEDFAVDPFAPIGGVDNQPGWPGQPSLNVTVDNLPDTGLGVPGIPGMPTVTGPGGGTPPEIADLIASMAAARGYNPTEQLAIVAYALGESGLIPSRSGGVQRAAGEGGTDFEHTVLGLFQQKPAFARAGGIDPSQRTDAVANITAYLNQLEKNRGMGIMAALPATSGGGPLAGGSTQQDWISLMERAAQILGEGVVSGASQLSDSLSSATSGLTTGFEGLTPLAKSLEGVVRQAFPQLGTIGGQETRPPDTPQGHTKGLALDIMIPGGTTRGGLNPAGKALGDQIWAFLNQYAEQLGLNIAGSLWQTDVGGDHFDHIHAAVLESMAQATGGISAVPTDFSQNMFATTGPSMINPATGLPGQFVVDQQAVARAAQALKKAGDDLSKSGFELAVAIKQFQEGLISQQDLLDKQNKYEDDRADLLDKQGSFTEAQRGKFQEAQPLDITELPWGHPARILGGAILGAGGTKEDVAAFVGPILGSVGQPIGQAVGDAVNSALTTPLPGPLGYPGVPTAPSTPVNQLIEERNPLAVLQMAGFNIPSYMRQGGGAGAQNLTLGGGPPADATGRIYSDTAALIDRTFTNQDAAAKARHDQLITVLNEVKDRVSEGVLKPIITAAVKAALEGLSTEAGKALGGPMGETAGPPIAAAVADAIPSGGGPNTGGVGGQLVNTGWDAVGGALGGAFGLLAVGSQGEYTGLPPTVGKIGALYDEGGVWPPGTFGSNVSGLPERVLSPEQTRLFDAGLLGGWNTQPLQQHMATTSGVNVNDVVGAEFFGVSQIPIIGAIVNLLVKVLLSILGIEIEARDTLDEMSKDFRAFRGDQFQAFDAMGRLMNDTSGLIDRAITSEEAAAQERIRILKIVIEALIKYIIEKLIVPIAKAVGQSLVSAAAGAAQGAAGAFPGGSIVGGIVGSVIQTAGNAAIEIAAEIFTDFALALTAVGVDAISELLQTFFPDLITDIFSGASLAAIFDPIGALISGGIAAILSPFLALLGGISLPFDDGGLARGRGLMPKATVRPERVLSPDQTLLFERLVYALESGKLSGNRLIEIHAPFNVNGNEQGGRIVRDNLLSLLS